MDIVLKYLLVAAIIITVYDIAVKVVIFSMLWHAYRYLTGNREYDEKLKRLITRVAELI